VNNYAVEVKPTARKELEVQTRIAGPRPTAYRMQKAEGLSRSGARPRRDWRVLYIIDDAAKLVSVTRIAHRREVYD